MTSPSRHRTGQETAFFSLSEATGLGGTWGLLEGVEHLGCENASTSTRTPSTLTLAGEHLEDDESSFKVAVFKGPAEPLGALLEGAAEPLDAILGGLVEPLEAVLGRSAEPLSVSEEHLADSQGNPGVSQYHPRQPGRSLSASQYRSGSAR